ncbi:glycosyltransferase [Actinopolymorpha alba]|uniref:glycosyltransferase n=1 Tax=Actinopolymorpha alba TaxID=533267 RepID=UPI00035F4393|nr:glycosyltransferase [Actinopolymorpha alba]
MLITRRIGHEPKLAVDDALRALSAHDWTRPRGGLLAYYPVVRGNPFQALLYSRLESAGLVPVPTYDVTTTLDVTKAIAGSGLDIAVHLHWLNVVMAKADNEATARESMKHYLESLHALKDLGARVMWTVHNILPHETRFPELESELRQGVVAAAERVHVMSPRTRELVAPWFDIPVEKLLSVPHPAYHDVYPSWMSRDQARLELNIAPDVTVFLLIGRVQPYKGLTELLDAFDRLCEREPGKYVLLVAGPPNREEETQAFRDRLLTHPSAYAALRKIPDEEMQVYLRAADIAVFPYRRSLNSGALALALTFGLPVVLRQDSGEGTRVSPSYAVQYDGDEPDGLLDALTQAAQRLATPEARASAAGAANRIAPGRVAGAFAATVREWLDGGSTA